MGTGAGGSGGLGSCGDDVNGVASKLLFFSEPAERDMLAAVIAAPVAALTAAMIAMVDFDMLRADEEGQMGDIKERKAVTMTRDDDEDDERVNEEGGGRCSGRWSG
jgi:hypothetical protein